MIGVDLFDGIGPQPHAELAILGKRNERRVAQRKRVKVEYGLFDRRAVAFVRVYAHQVDMVERTFVEDHIFGFKLA